MEIDIISYTAEQLAELTPEQLKEVRSAQLKKNKMAKDLEERLAKERQKLIHKGTYFSDAWGLLQKQLRKEHDKEVEILRDGLLFFLDYSLSEEERFYVVQGYYQNAYTDGTERFNAFKEDTVAKQYLGELYASLYDYFLEDA